MVSQVKLHEIKLLETAKDLGNFKDFLEKNCAPYFKAADLAPLDTIVVNSPNLFRGISRSTKVDLSLKDNDGQDLHAAIKNVRLDRQPKDTHPQLSRVVDNLLHDKFGWKPRSEGVFCFGNKSNYSTGDFGKPSVIFPIGDIKYVWSDDVYDLTILIKSVLKRINIRNIDPDDEPYDQEELDKFKKAFEEKYLPGYIDTNLDHALMSSSEIIIKCSKYLAIPIGDI